MSRLFAAARACAPLALAACATTPHPLEGRLFDARTGAFVERAALLDEAARTPYVLLGERHDMQPATTTGRAFSPAASKLV